MSDDELDEDSSLLLRSAVEPTAFTHFYRRNRDDILAWLYSRTFDAEVAADLAAEVFATVIEQRSRFDPARGPARAWLWGIASVQLRQWHREGQAAERARRRLGMPVLAVSDEATAYVEALIDRQAALRELKEHLDTLPDGERAALELRIFYELPYNDIAAKLDCAPGAARVRVSRALARLRTRLETNDQHSVRELFRP
jgi:RNA polymerase sigma-70 factor (ECF subfamily)